VALTTSASSRRVRPRLRWAILVFILIAVVLLPPVTTAMATVAGPLPSAPFEVPGTLVSATGPDGCVRIVDGRGAHTTGCVTVVGEGPVEAFWNADDDLIVTTGGFDTALALDPATGATLGGVSRGKINRGRGDLSEDAYVNRDEMTQAGYVTTEGSKVVRRYDNARTRGPMEPYAQLRPDEILLDVGGPPWFRLQHALFSPDGEWLIVHTNYSQVLVAPADGSAAPRVWTQGPLRWEWWWFNLHGAVRWE
jgi:hypothetical protein